MTTDSRDRDHPLLLPAMALGVVTAGVLMQPLLRFADRVPVAIGGTLIAASIVVSVWPGATVASAKSRRLWIALPALVAGMALLLWAGLGASSASMEFDRECRAIQEAMLRPAPADDGQPRGARPVDQFRAFGCRPQR